jgi:hypothetical protein
MTLPDWLEERRHWASCNNKEIVEMLDLIEELGDELAAYEEPVPWAR